MKYRYYTPRALLSRLGSMHGVRWTNYNDRFENFVTIHRTIAIVQNEKLEAAIQSSVDCF